MIVLRKYQKEAITAIENAFIEVDRQFIEMPTGAGKTVTFLSYAAKNHSYILIVVPSKELLKQVYSSCLLFWHPHQISRKGNGFDEELSNVHICIINSLTPKYIKEISTEEFDLVIIDEAHHIQSNSYVRLVDSLFKTQVIPPKFLGVTATPDRLDGKLISDILFKKSFSVSIDQLIDDKYLCDVEGYVIKTNIDISDVDDHNGDFSITQLYKRLSTDARNGLILSICMNEMTLRKKLIFCINIDHCKQISHLLNLQGISSKAIYGSMNENEKYSILASFRKGEITCLCNCQLLTEGFDEPSIDGIILARPTKSRSLFMQMIGRGLRISPGKKNCKIIDIVDNHNSLSCFSELVKPCKYNRITSFTSIKDLRHQIEKEEIESIETKIKRVNFFSPKEHLDEEELTPSMYKYIGDDLRKYGSLSFDEASFLIWITELRKEYSNGN